MIEFRLAGAPYYGFTYNLSPLGVFVRSIRIPNLGASPSPPSSTCPTESASRSTGASCAPIRAPTALARLVPSGFGMTLASSPEEYFQFLAAL